MTRARKYFAIPPAGTALPESLCRAIFGGSEGSAIDVLARYLGTPNVIWVSSGRTALWLCLSAMSRLRPKRKKVIIPAYTCPALASAVLAAGLQPVLVDIDREGFDYCLSELSEQMNGECLAVIAVHLLGYPAHIDGIERLCRRWGAFLVEDAAQAFGNSYDGCCGGLLGTRGDAGFFSFGRGKAPTALHGGLLVARSDHVYTEARKIFAAMKPLPAVGEAKILASLLAYRILRNPRLYWMVAKTPFLHIGKTVFEPGVDRFRGSKLIGKALRALIETVEDDRGNRLRNARWYRERLAALGLPGLAFGRSYPCTRYPIMVKRKSLRDALLMSLASAGASGLYPCPLNELPRLRDVLHDDRIYRNARRTSDAIVTLPVHAGVTNRVRELVLSAFEQKVATFWQLDQVAAGLEVAS